MLLWRGDLLGEHVVGEQMSVAETATGAARAPAFEITTSRQFTAWLAEVGAALAFTTYQAGKLFFIGLKPDGKLWVHERTFERCMGLACSGNALLLASLWQLWRFENTLALGQKAADGADRLYVPQVAWVTGDLDIHDVAFDGAGRPVFANTLFSCIATASESASFVPLWKPGFVSKLAAEDRCHLNGLAMAGGKPGYVTAVGPTDVADAWRNHRAGGGVTIDVASDEIVAAGLSMPHSPRVHEGRLWLLNSGTGGFGHVDLAGGRFEPVTFLPGYGRGLAIHGRFAVIGLSKSRQNRTFTGVLLDDALAQKKAEARCGLFVVDLTTGDIVHSLRVEGVVEELYDVVVLPKARMPAAIGIKSDEIRRVISVG